MALKDEEEKKSSLHSNENPDCRKASLHFAMSNHKTHSKGIQGTEAINIRSEKSRIKSNHLALKNACIKIVFSRSQFFNDKKHDLGIWNNDSFPQTRVLNFEEFLEFEHFEI